MTTETKAAMDALNKLTAYSPFAMEEMEEDALGEYVKLSDVENLIVALTAQAEAQPADDEVREAVEAAHDYIQHHIDGEDEGVLDGYVDDGAIFTFKHLKTLIRAATAPKNAPERYYL